MNYAGEFVHFNPSLSSMSLDLSLLNTKRNAWNYIERRGLFKPPKDTPDSPEWPESHNALSFKLNGQSVEFLFHVVGRSPGVLTSATVHNDWHKLGGTDPNGDYGVLVYALPFSDEADSFNFQDIFLPERVVQPAAGALHHAGDGNDEVTLWNGGSAYATWLASDIFYAEGGDDRVTGGNLGDAIWGGPGNDWIDGAGGEDHLHGHEGDDTLISGAGDINFLYGGSGNDEYHVARDADFVIETPGDANDVVIASASYVLESGAEIEFLRPQNPNSSLSPINLTGNEFGQTITGDAGGNILRGREGADSLIGGAGDDILEGGPGPDHLSGQFGEDAADYRNSDGAIDVNLQNGTAYGGDAEGDTFDFANSVEDVHGSRYDDVIVGDELHNALYGGDGNDWLVGHGGVDFLVGGNGNDSLTDEWGELGGADNINGLDGGQGDDVYEVSSLNTVAFENPDAGEDWLYAYVSFKLPDNFERLYLDDEAIIGTGNNADNVITGSAVRNDLSGRAGADYIIAGGGNDVVRGNSGQDTLYGQDGRDQLNGGSKDDILVGGDGNDGLAGGTGKDMLWGEAGRDVFAFYAPQETGPGGGDRDFIADFDPDEDWMWLVGMDADATQSGDQAFTWVGGSTVFSGNAGELHYFHVGQTSYVEGDIDGDANEDFQIELAGKLRLTADSFFL